MIVWRSHCLCQHACSHPGASPDCQGCKKEQGEGGIWLHSRSLLITFAEERVKATIARFRKEKLTNCVGRLQWQNMLQASLPRSHPSPIHTNMQLKVTTFTTFSLLTLFIGFVWIREVWILGKGATQVFVACIVHNLPFSRSLSFGETSRILGAASLEYDKAIQSTTKSKNIES